MGFYENRILPRLLHLVMRQENLSAYRRRCVPAARGRVLEIGVGSGLNLPFYTGAATEVIGLDASSRLLQIARESQVQVEAAAKAKGGAGASSIQLIEGSAEAIPLDDRSFDTVVTTWTLCSIHDVDAALREIRRVLKPEGQLLFVEHGASPDRGVHRWQNRITPAWKRIAGGCHLNRPIRELLERSGFRIERLDTGYMKGPKPMTFQYEGSARPIPGEPR